MSENSSLVQLDEARRMLSEINSVDEVKSIRDKAEAMRVYADCFPRKIYPTDVDGLIEMNGKFLLIETKLPNAVVPIGQKIALERLSSIKEFTVFLVFGKRNRPEKIQYLKDGKYSAVYTCNKETLRQWFKRWVSNVTPRNSP